MGTPEGDRLNWVGVVLVVLFAALSIYAVYWFVVAIATGSLPTA